MHTVEYVLSGTGGIEYYSSPEHMKVIAVFSGSLGYYWPTFVVGL